MQYQPSVFRYILRHRSPGARPPVLKAVVVNVVAILAHDLQQSGPHYTDHHQPRCADADAKLQSVYRLISNPIPKPFCHHKFIYNHVCTISFQLDYILKRTVEALENAQPGALWRGPDDASLV